MNSPAIADEALEVFLRCRRELEEALEQLGFPAVVEKAQCSPAEYQRVADESGRRYRVSRDGVDELYVPAGAPEAE